ncbi:transcriptional regulator TbsP (plasmid) [Halococcus morrhuae DSM 1307]|uniref:transcriptional regulator TbsP n=1 Tax=Halococcus morrhuae TaxID=2250 RepID=UPI003F861799
MTSKHVGQSVAENLRTILADASGEVIAVGLDENATRELVEMLAESEEPPNVRLLGGDDVLKWLRDDFMLASTAAGLREADVLELRAAAERLDDTLLVTEEMVVSLLTPGDGQSAALVTDDEEFVAAVRERWNYLWGDGAQFDLRTPAYSRVLETLADEFDSETEADFETVLESIADMDTDDWLNEVAVSLLVAAKHEQLLYDISHWGEDAGVASKATFSRTKTRLEDQGLLETEKVPIDVGRPRLRLLLGDERLREADAEELASVANEMLSVAPA